MLELRRTVFRFMVILALSTAALRLCQIAAVDCVIHQWWVSPGGCTRALP